MDLLTPTLPFIANLQKFKELLPLMQFFSILGTEFFYLALLPIIYWGFSRPLGVRLGALLLFSVVVNEIFKVGFAQPRPYWLDATLQNGNEASFGLPSGHAQNAFLIWPFLALQTSNRRVWMPLALLLACCISFSRIYLGVHFPTDIVGGVVIGLTILGFYRFGGLAWMRFWHQLSAPQKIIFGFFATAFLGGIYAIGLSVGTHGYGADYNSPALPAIQNAMAGGVIASRLGAFFGLICGAVLTARFVTFQARAPIEILAVRFCLGFIGLVAFYVGTKEIFPDGIAWSFLRYGLTTFWVVFGAVWTFQKLRINGVEKTEVAI